MIKCSLTQNGMTTLSQTKVCTLMTTIRELTGMITITAITTMICTNTMSMSTMTTITYTMLSKSLPLSTTMTLSTGVKPVTFIVSSSITDPTWTQRTGGKV